MRWSLRQVISSSRSMLDEEMQSTDSGKKVDDFFEDLEHHFGGKKFNFGRLVWRKRLLKASGNIFLGSLNLFQHILKQTPNYV